MVRARTFFADWRKDELLWARICLKLHRQSPLGFQDLVNNWAYAIALGLLGKTQRACNITRKAGKSDEQAMKIDTSAGLSRRALLGAFAATLVTAAPTYSKAAGFLRGSGDIRRIRMYSGRTGERMDTIYWIEGAYIPEAVAEVNHFMRDWRTDGVKQIDLRTVDIMSAAHNLLDVNEPYMLLSGYRSPQTNAMLRARSRGVAKNSLHVKGQAADLRLSSRSVRQLAQAAAACKGGGVGKYSRSNFVHMDCGVVRTWGR